MKVWLFDDCAFPSGYGAGKIKENHPEYLKIYLDERHIDVRGPLKNSSFIIKAWIDADEKLIRVIGARRANGEDNICEESLIDLTNKIDDGILYWNVPEGDWRVFIFVRTRKGGEEGTRDYINPIEAEPVKAFINYIYEEHYKHFGNEFGKTIAGFFSDEPRFGNAPTYEGRLGNMRLLAPYTQSGAINKMVLPYSDSLIEELDKQWGKDFGIYLPYLWYEGGDKTFNIRYTYMDVVSKLYSENFSMQIGDWCRQHQVKYIGHVVEDNGAHARLGYGSGHFFRAVKGQDYSGLDVVYQIWPEHTTGKLSTPFGYLESEFFYWGITKMASSAAHIDPKKNGVTVCEVFGAYGWQEGLKLMKWLTDHICVRGVNFLIPHAFSPKFHDVDCPPHFYARGTNPQLRYFNIWSQYANRVCHLLTGGRHVAPVAVIYHAEAEWSGDYMPFEQVVKALAAAQIDCDIIPIDSIIHNNNAIIDDGKLKINNEQYKAVVIPYSQRLPHKLINRLYECVLKGIPVIFINDYPENSSDGTEDFILALNALKTNMCCNVVTLNHLSEWLKKTDVKDIELTSIENNLRYYHYVKDEKDIYFFTNESKYDPIETFVLINDEREPFAYDGLNDKWRRLQYVKVESNINISLYLEPYESLFIIFGFDISSNMENRDDFLRLDFRYELEISAVWDIFFADAKAYPQFKKVKRLSSLCNVAAPGLLPEFSGTLRYNTEFEFVSPNDKERVYLSLGEVYEIAEVWVNGENVGVRICPPYRFDISRSIKRGKNSLCIEVVNTLAKEVGNNCFDRAMVQEPTGLLGPVKISLHQT